jgi:hypothetical protein
MCDVVLKADTECNVIDHHHHEWRMVGQKTVSLVTAPANSTTGKVYSELHLVVMVVRYHGWYIVNIGVFMAAMVVMGLSVFVMSPEDTGDRNEAAMALILAIVATKFTLSEKLPKLEYQTLADLYISLSSGFLSLVVLANAVGAVLCYRVGLEDAQTVDRILFCAIAALYVGVHGLYYHRWTHYRRKQQEWEASRAPYTTEPQSSTVIATNGKTAPAELARMAFKTKLARRKGEAAGEPAVAAPSST